jgi:hypothetical protein
MAHLLQKEIYFWRSVITRASAYGVTFIYFHSVQCQTNTGRKVKKKISRVPHVPYLNRKIQINTPNLSSATHRSVADLFLNTLSMMVLTTLT